MDPDLSLLPFWVGKVSGILDGCPSLDQGKMGGAVFLGIYMKSDVTRNPLMQPTGICLSLDLV